MGSSSRSKKGCFTCRLRRKKCDEQKPRCTGCQRNYLACNWPRYDKQTLRSFSSEREDDQLLIESSQAGALDKNRQAFLEHDEEDKYKDNELLRFILGPFVNLIAPELIKGRVKAHFLSQLRRSPAFITISECLGEKYVKDRSDYGDLLYVETIGLIKKELESTNKDIREDWILNIITFFIFRELGTDSPQLQNITTHMRAAFEIISQRILGGATTFGLYISADSFLYHYSLVVLCCLVEMESQIPNSLVVEKVWEVLYGNARHNSDVNPLLANKYVAYIYLCHAAFLLRFPLLNNWILAKTVMKKLEVSLLKKDSPFKRAVLMSTKLILLHVIHKGDPSFSKVQSLEAPFLDALVSSSDEELRLFGLWPITACALICKSKKSRETLMSIYYRARDESNPLRSLIEEIWNEDTGFHALDDLTVMQKMFLQF